MLLKNHLIEVYKKASSENNFFLKENVVLRWVHRFGINSLDDLIINSPVQKENQQEENQEQISLIDEENEENQAQNQERIRLESLKISENLKETQYESNYLENSINNEITNSRQDFNQKNKYTEISKLPLPYIKNLRKWINKDKKAS